MFVITDRPFHAMNVVLNISAKVRSWVAACLDFPIESILLSSWNGMVDFSVRWVWKLRRYLNLFYEAKKNIDHGRREGHIEY